MTDARALIEAMVAAFNRGDIAFVLDRFAEDCSLRETRAPELAYAGSFSGRAGVRQFFDKMLGVLEPSRLEIDRWVCEGDDIVAMGSWSGKARNTGKPFDSHLSLYFRVRDGKVVEFRGHDDTAVIAAALRG